MRSGWEGNTRLQDFVRRPGAGARLVAEVVTVTGAEIIATKSGWGALTVSSGSVDVLVSGGVRIQASENTLAEHVDPTDTDTTRLTTVPTFDAILIEHLGTGAESREFHTLTARLDPRSDGGSPKTVDHFIAEAYRVTRRVGADEIHVELIARSAPVVAAGEVGADFDFVLQPTSGRYPVTGPPPADGSSSRPFTLFRIIAYRADGSIADNVSWLSDSVQGSSKTDSSTYQVTHYSVAAATRQGQAKEGGSVWDLVGVVGNMPRFSLTKASYAQAIVTATSASAVPDISGTGDLVIVARGEEWGDSALTWEIYDGAVWIECVDGDVIGSDNRVTIDGIVFGKDLSGVSTTGPWDMRVTLDPSTNNLRTPVAIDFGVERVSRTLLAGAATVLRGERRVDPLSLKAEIPKVEIHIQKTGEKDYRDYGSEILSANHIGDIEIRVHAGDPSEAYLHRSEWMLHSVWDIEDYHSTASAHVIEGLSPLRLLRVPIPPFVATSGNDGTRKAVQVIGTRKAAYDEILDSFVGLPARYKGPGVEDTTNSVKKTIKDGDAKDELDRIAYLGGETNIESQGRIKAVRVRRDEPIDYIVARFPLGSYTPIHIGPGFGTRTDEFFVRYNFEESDERFENERRYLNATALDKLGGAGLNTTQKLDEEAARWIITNDLADAIGNRVPKHFGNGQIIWEIQANDRNPQLELGDMVIVETDRFVARSPINDQPIRGPVSAVAIVVFVGDSWGQRLDLWVPGFEYITVGVGTVTRDGFGVPDVLDGVFDVALIPVMQGSSRRHEFQYTYRWGADVDEAEVRLSWTGPGPTFITLVKVMTQSGDGVARVEENLSSSIAKIPEDATDLLFAIKGRNSGATSKWGKTFSWRLDDMADATAGMRTSDGTTEYLSKRTLVGRGLSLALVAGEPEYRLETDVSGAGSKSADFTLDANDGLIQSVSISASVDLTNISNLIGSEPFLLRLSAATNTLTLDAANFEGPKLTFTGTAAISFVDFGTGKITAMGGDW